MNSVLGALRITAFFAFAAIAVGCGKKGPPLPPLVKIPVAPGDFTAERRGDQVTVQFTVPASNTDNTKPANIERVDVYALTAPASVPDDVLLKRGTIVGSVDVKAPRNPEDAVDADEPDADAEPPEGAGLDQGAAAHVDDGLTAATLVPPNLATVSRKSAPASRRPAARPGTRGAFTRVRRRRRQQTRPEGLRVAPRRRSVASAAPGAVAARGRVRRESGACIVAGRRRRWFAAPPHPLGIPEPTVAYNVYDVPRARDGTVAEPLRLTKSPSEQASFDDPRMEWGKERCYAIRAVASFGNLSVESDLSAPACRRLTDTFAPAAPHGLRAIGTERAVNLIWDPNSEADLAGYIVLRGTSPRYAPAAHDRADPRHHLSGCRGAWGALLVCDCRRRQGGKPERTVGSVEESARQ